MSKLIFCFLLSFSAAAWAESTILLDNNRDGAITILGFGDSLTYGVGDGTLPGQLVTELNRTDGQAGYLSRLATLLGVPTENGGIPGEFLVEEGEKRFPRVLEQSHADIVAILEGANDAFQGIDSETFTRVVQKLINVSKALGRTPVLLTLPPPCCDHSGLAPFIDEYSRLIREAAVLNEVGYAELDRAWRTSCENKTECELFNLPEGLHPNSKGYDVIAQTVASTALGVDLFTKSGAGELAAALGLAESDIVVKPDL